MTYHQSIISSILTILCLTATAQTHNLNISAELRPRTLVDNGYSTPKSTDESTHLYTTQRTRLNASFANDKLETFISFQDVRLWGGDNNYKSSGSYGNTESLGLHLGWVKLNFNQQFSLKIGRQLFSYDDQRIISARNWNDYQVTYDALLLEYKKENQHIHLGITYNAESKNDNLLSEDKYKTYDFIHYQYQAQQLSASVIAVITGKTLSDTTETVALKGTYGTNLDYKTEKFNAHAAVYYQHNLNNHDGKSSAYCFSLYAEQQILEKLNAGLKLDYLSGNDETSTTTTDHQFDILYGRRHSYYGYMDYFSNTPEQGLQDYMIKLTFKPLDKLNLQMHYHYFLLSANSYDIETPTETRSRKLGQELDIKLKSKIYNIAELEFGYSIYGMTNTLKQLKDVEGLNLKTPQFCYIILTVSPSVLINLSDKHNDE